MVEIKVDETTMAPMPGRLRVWQAWIEVEGRAVFVWVADSREHALIGLRNALVNVVREVERKIPPATEH